MPISITTLLAVVFASCLRDTLALNVVLQAEDTHSRSQWGVDDILLTCRSGNEGTTNTIHNAIFTRDQEAITISDYDDCTSGGDQYCYTQNGERLSFTVNSTTEGKYACNYPDQASNEASNELAIVGK